MNKPIAVLISDIHFNINTLDIASKALEAALSKSEELQVPLIIAGDLHDTKAIIRAEVANRLLSIFSKFNCDSYLIIGNHDLINEKGTEHSLNFLYDKVNLVERPEELLGMWLIPYESNSDELTTFLAKIPKKGSILIMHQGFLGANMGDYVQDKTSISLEVVKDFIVISGHYHRHQTIGTVTYIGSPYTITFGEANDGPKGFLILNSDGSFTREILHLRKHVILERDATDLVRPESSIRPEDLVRLKIRGSREELDKINKTQLSETFGNPKVFKIDKIYNETPQLVNEDKKLSVPDLFDKIIDNEWTNESERTYVKQLWRKINGC